MPAKKTVVKNKSRKTKTATSVVAKKVSTVKGESRSNERNVSKVAQVSKVGSSAKLAAELFDISGKKHGTITLSKEIFGQKPNKRLLSQAIHVYRVNSSAHYGSTKTRSNVRGGGAKPWRQKGTGRARAGSRRSPLWVGGAKALGPIPRKVLLALPKKMNRQALLSALCTKAQQGDIKVISNIEKIEPKTKIVASFLQKTNLSGKTLLIISHESKETRKNVHLATRNIQDITLDTAQDLNTFEVLANKHILIAKEALNSLEDRFTKTSEQTKK